MRNFYTGLGAATGVAAADLAASGFTGSLAALTGRASGISKGIRDLAALTDAIDPSRLRIAQDYFKLHSASALSHPAIDAVLAMGPLDLHQVRNIEVETGERAMRLARGSVGNPLSSRFSLPFAVAVAVKHGRAGPELFSADREVAELASRVTVRSDPGMSAKWPEQLPARVTVNMANGQNETTSGQQRARTLHEPPGRRDHRGEIPAAVLGVEGARAVQPPNGHCVREGCLRPLRRDRGPLALPPQRFEPRLVSGRIRRLSSAPKNVCTWREKENCVKSF